MTALLQEVFQKASLLPDEIQNILTEELLQKLEWETKWDATLTEEFV